MKKVKRSVLLIAQLLLLVPLVASFILSTWTAWRRYNLPYNEMGRHFDEGHVVVYEEQAIEVYVLISIVLFAAVALMVRLMLKTIRLKPAKTVDRNL
jgi:hypothetical protein